MNSKLIVALSIGLGLMAVWIPSAGLVALADTAAAENPYASFKRPSDGELKHTLTPEQFYVTREEGTEKPFKNAYWNNERPGIYVDVISGEPLFSSKDKYDSGTGWPSFTAPINPGAVKTREERIYLIMKRTEVRSTIADSHLGHVFNDGPPPTGKRWCMNSAALRFVPLEDMAKEGYAKYLPLFEKPAEGKP